MMKTRKVIIHVGPPKTGTTAVQELLFRARDRLSELGIRYARSGCLGNGEKYYVRRPSGRTAKYGPGIAQHLLPWSLLDEVEGLRAEDCWTALQSEITECQEPTLVVSSEAFSRLDGERIAAVAQYLGGSDVRIVSYLRLPFKRMLSDYTQRIKGGYYYKSFQDFVAEVEPLISNYDRFVTGWDEHFGAQNVYLRSFDRALQSGGIEDDFAELLLGGDKSELLKFSSGARANVSPSDHAVSRMRAINRVESGLGRPAALRRVFSAVRRMAAANGALGNIANRLLTSGPIVAGQDRERIEMLAADRYDSLASRCTSGPIM